jgi:spoIIIJ-associated protein
MSAKDSVEVTAPTVDDAVSQALIQLGATEDDVVIEVLSTPRSGLLGLGSREARVRVSLRPTEGAHSEAQSPPPAPARRAQSESLASPQPVKARGPEPSREPRREAPRPPRDEPAEAGPEAERAEPGRPPANMAEQEREATAILAQILELMGEKAEVRVTASDAEAIEIEIKGDGSGILIGRHGQTLDALEYLLNRVVARKIKDAVAVVIDTESYRARRRSQLERMALSMGERTKREHTKMVMEPMAPRDRRIVHLTLKDDPLLTTRSTGEGYMRTVEILPVEGRPERGGDRGGGGGSGGGGGGNRGRGRPRERETEAPVGQQGGFARGQKRIV